MPAPLFKRFAPPTPATQKHSSVPASSPVSVQNDVAEKALSPEAAPSKKEKKIEKRKSELTEPTTVPVESQKQNEDVIMEDVSAEVPRPNKKSKKRKSELIEEQDEEVSKKHKAVLSKFEKASRLAEARKDQGSAEDETQQPEEELHGTMMREEVISHFVNIEQICNLCLSLHPYQSLSLRQLSQLCRHGSLSPSPSKQRKQHHSRSLVHNHTMSKNLRSWGSKMLSLFRLRCCQCCIAGSSSIWVISACLRRLGLARQWHICCQ